MDKDILISLDNIIKIQDLGFHSINKLYTHPDRKLDWDVFLYVSGGQMEVWEEEKEYTVKKGQFLFLKKGLHHWGEPKTPPGTSWHWIHFYSSKLSEACQEMCAYISPCQTFSVSGEEYVKYIRLPKQGNIPFPKKQEKSLERMIELFKSGGNLRAINLSLQTMELFLEIYKESMYSFSLSKSDHTVQRIIEYLEKKDSYDLNSKELENNLHMNYSYLCEIFKNKTGGTIHNYNSQVFINKAVIIMRNSDWNISEISDQLGFKNPFYFSRVFGKVMGCSPSEYRNRIYRNMVK